MKRRHQGILTGMPFMANIASRTFVDDLGRRLYLAHAPQRIVSLAPSVTELVFALGAGDRVIAVTSSCNYPPEAAQKPKLPEAGPDVESLAALDADLVLAVRAVMDRALIEQLEQLKISLYVMEARTIEDVLAQIHTVGRMLDRGSAATQLVSDMRGRFKRVKARTAPVARPRLLYVRSGDPLMTVGPGSVTHQLIELAGAENIGARLGAASSAIAMDELVRHTPDVLLIPVGESAGISEFLHQLRTRGPGIGPVQAPRLYHIDSALLDRPGPRIIEGLERLAALLHPEAFRDAPHQTDSPKRSSP
jgi:iron complex transport system substrate-binding protein